MKAMGFAWIIIGVAIGYGLGWLQLTNEHQKFEAYRNRSGQIMDEIVAASQQMQAVLKDNSRIAEENDNLFKQVMQIAEEALVMAKQGDGEKYRALKVKYERLLATLN